MRKGEEERRTVRVEKETRRGQNRKGERPEWEKEKKGRERERKGNSVRGKE